MSDIACFARWLERTFQHLESLGGLEADAHTDAMQAAALVRDASKCARKIGAGDLAVRRFPHHEGEPYYPVQDAKSVIGRMLKWCDDSWPEDVPLTPKQAARQMNVSRTTVYKLCSQRLLDHHRVGGKILIPLKAIRAYEENGRPKRRLRHL
jgi:excisionase family DNA binding protein